MGSPRMDGLPSVGLHSLSVLGEDLVFPHLTPWTQILSLNSPLTHFEPYPLNKQSFCSVSFDSGDTEMIGMQTSFCHVLKMLVYFEEDRWLLWLGPIEEEMLGREEARQPDEEGGTDFFLQLGWVLGLTPMSVTFPCNSHSTTSQRWKELKCVIWSSDLGHMGAAVQLEGAAKFQEGVWLGELGDPDVPALVVCDARASECFLYSEIFLGVTTVL